MLLVATGNRTPAKSVGLPGGGVVGATSALAVEPVTTEEGALPGRHGRRQLTTPLKVGGEEAAGVSDSFDRCWQKQGQKLVSP